MIAGGTCHERVPIGIFRDASRLGLVVYGLEGPDELEGPGVRVVGCEM